MIHLGASKSSVQRSDDSPSVAFTSVKQASTAARTVFELVVCMGSSSGCLISPPLFSTLKSDLSSIRVRCLDGPSAWLFYSVLIPK